MTTITRFFTALAITATLALGACSGDADVDVDNDTTDVNADTNAMDLAPDANDTVGDNNNDTLGGVSTGGEGVEKLVEAQLVLSPGFAGVTVESEGEGMIVLNGTVKSEEEKTKAETEAKGVSGVVSVKNNLTVAP